MRSGGVGGGGGGRVEVGVLYDGSLAISMSNRRIRVLQLVNNKLYVSFRQQTQ